MPFGRRLKTRECVCISPIGTLLQRLTLPCYMKIWLSRREILRAIGYPEPPGPGGNTKVPSFARDNASSRKGVVFGHRFPDPVAKASETPGVGA